MRRTKRLPLEELAPYLWSPPDPPPLAASREALPLTPPTPIDWPAIFGNDHPVEIEVGCGKGAFLLAAALARPDVNFFGVEIVRKYQLYTATRMAVRKLSHVRVACDDAF